MKLQNKTMLMRISESIGRKRTLALFCQSSNEFLFIVIVVSQSMN